MPLGLVESGGKQCCMTDLVAVRHGAAILCAAPVRLAASVPSPGWCQYGTGQQGIGGSALHVSDHSLRCALDAAAW